MKLPKDFASGGFSEMLEQAKEAIARAQELEPRRIEIGTMEPKTTTQTITDEHKGVPSSVVLLNYAALVLSFIGIFVASVLSLGHALAKSVPCGENGGCDVVASSPASLLFGFPVAYLGLAAYLLLAAISATRAIKGLANTAFLGTVALSVSGIGALFSFYLQYLSFTQIHALCLWCLTSAITMCLLFLLQAWLAQTEIPKGANAAGGNGVIVTAGLSFVALLAIGYQGLTFIHTAPNLNNLGLANDSLLVRLLLTQDSMKIGPDDAPIKVIEFSDLLCPSCRAYYPSVKKLVEGSHGKVQLLLRHRPLIKNEDHKMALPAAVVAEYASSKGKGWQFVDAMYAHDISELQTQEAITKIGKSVGLDMADAQKHMKPEDPVWKRVQRDIHTADDIKVTETPTFIIVARGQNPVAALGNELFSKIKEPAYQALINGK